MKPIADKRSGILEFLLSKSILFLLFLFFIAMASIKPSFLAWWNIQSILLDVSIYGVVASGMTILILCGEFDLSASSQFMWAQILFVSLLNATGSPLLSVAVTLVSGLALGTMNGIIVTRFRINSFITTLGTMTMIRGLCLVYTGGKMVSTQNEFIAALGGAQILGISSLTYIYAIIVAILSVVLAYTRFGRRIYATGGNPDLVERLETSEEKSSGHQTSPSSSTNSWMYLQLTVRKKRQWMHLSSSRLLSSAVLNS